MPQDLSWLPDQPKAAASSASDLSWLPDQPKARKPAAAEDFMTPEDIANRDMTAMDVVKGFGKGAARTAAGVVNMAAQSRMLPGVTPESVPSAVVDRFTPEYTNDAQELGGTLETIAEFALPAVRTGKAAASAAGMIPTAIKAAGPAARTAGGVALDVATGHPVRAAGKVLGFILDSAKPAAKAAEKVAAKPTPIYTGTSMSPVKMPDGSFSMPVPRPVAPAPVAPRPAVSGTAMTPPPVIASPGGFSMPAPRPAAPVPVAAPPVGRVVPPETPSINTALRDALEEIRTAAPMPRVELPPPVTLPAGYTPRATVPKPKAAKMAGPTAPEPAAPPKRAYFLKSEEELAAARAPRTETPTPAESFDVADLPASWQKHIGQDIFPITGKEGEAVAAELAQELMTRGMSRSEALMAVSKNKELPTKTKQQLMRALSRAKGGA